MGPNCCRGASGESLRQDRGGNCKARNIRTERVTSPAPPGQRDSLEITRSSGRSAWPSVQAFSSLGEAVRQRAVEGMTWQRLVA